MTAPSRNIACSLDNTLSFSDGGCFSNDRIFWGIIGVTKAFFIDPALKGESGHHLGFSRELSKAASAAGHKVVWLAHKDLDLHLVPDFVHFIPTFSSTIYEQQIGLFGRILRPLVGNRRFLRSVLAERSWETRLRQKSPLAWLNGDRSAELVRVLRAVRPGKDDHLIVHSADPQTVDMLSIWARGQLRDSLPGIHVRTCWPTSTMPFADYGGGFSRVARNLCSVSRAVTFSAETPAGARQLANETGRDVNICPHLPDEEILRLLPCDRTCATLTVGWLGGLRREKGTEIVADIVGAVLAAKSDKLPLKFLLQCVGNSRKAKKLQAQLAEFGDAVEMLNVVVSRDEYLAALIRCDMLLLPYDASDYPPERGSGTASEALLSGKPMIAMDGTFAATLIKTDSGAVGRDARTLAAGILTIAKNYDSFARGAERERERARTSYNREHCYRLLIGLT